VSKRAHPSDRVLSPAATEPEVSAHPGDAPLRAWQSLSTKLRQALLTVPAYHWLTASELKPEASGMGLTLLCTKHLMVDRRWTIWGGEPGQKYGEGYEYSLTPWGISVVGYATTPRDKDVSLAEDGNRLSDEAAAAGTASPQ